MTISVDNAGIRAAVHDSASEPDAGGEGVQLGLVDLGAEQVAPAGGVAASAAAWFQPGKRLGRPGEPDPAHDHYDLTANKRRHAIAAGATPVDMSQAVALWHAKREASNDFPR